ncbi:hypothetical protein [Candidatus Proelusimicrobium excrementi]|uniref:hypothetical protein n=1 Tax=Candidatus Proelusimicrobium excrementi TaxID=3416222 RepID=UPI003CB1821D|nr:hypothetical protein [Elusimicrobiaceae bacterium]MBR3927716.1 hypothetical protein [Clostridia bacterium]
MNYRGYTIQKADYPDKYNPSRVGFDILRGKETVKKNAVNTDTAKWVIDKLIERGKIPNYEDQD